jgi:primosomal protein N' (replication factor Y)
MGAGRSCRGASQGSRGHRLRRGTAPRVCRVLPDVPAVDRAFDYLVHDDWRAQLRVGAIVRVPLHGRRVRGWVLAVDVVPEASLDRLLPLRALVSAGPPPDLVELSAWAAWRWAGSRVAFLRAASPPNQVEPESEPELEAAVFPPVASPLPLTDASPRVVRWPPATPRLTLVRSLIATEGSTIVVAPDGREADALALALEAEGRHVARFRGDTPAATRTAHWEQARRGACVVVGGRIAVLAPVPDLQGVVVLDDVDEALKEERAPTWHAFVLAAERARRAGARLDVVSPTPGAEAMSSAHAIDTPVRAEERAGWARVEVVDLGDEQPGAGLLTSALADALHRTLDRRARALCVLNRRGRARLLACRTCGTIARCPRCEAAWAEAPDGLECPRCRNRSPALCQACGSTKLRPLRAGVVRIRDHLAALVPRAAVVAVESGSAPVPAFDIAVGTEAVLHRVAHWDDRPIELVAFLDFDQELLAPRYRAVEQALWLVVRAGRRVGPREGRGLVLVQTRFPEDPVIGAARDGDPGPVLEMELARRRALSFPPFGGLAELSGDAEAVEAACEELSRLAGPVVILGPAQGRALARAPSAAELCDALAAADLSAARAHGRLRVDVEPLRV